MSFCSSPTAAPELLEYDITETLGPWMFVSLLGLTGWTLLCQDALAERAPCQPNFISITSAIETGHLSRTPNREGERVVVPIFYFYSRKLRGLILRTFNQALE